MALFPKLQRKSRRELLGTVCPLCGELIRVKGFTRTRYAYRHRSAAAGVCTAFFGLTYSPRVVALVQNSSPPAAAAGQARRSRRSKTRRRAPHGGGRPKSFIAALVVAEAARLHSVHRRWSEVLERLRSSGNGTYARNTLIRRVVDYSSSQNQPELQRRRPGRRAARAPSKTGRRMLAPRR